MDERIKEIKERLLAIEQEKIDLMVELFNLTANAKRSESDAENIPLESLGFSSRTYNILYKNGIRTLYDIRDTKDFEFEGLGLRYKREIEEKMQSLGFTNFKIN